MRLIFSRDRAAQLDLLLRSLDANAPEDAYTAVLCHYLDTDAYRILEREHSDVRFWQETDFNMDLRAGLAFAASDTVTFFCDDDVLYRPVPSLGADVLLADELVLTFSLRLGQIDSSSYGLWRLNKRGLVEWMWSPLPRNDHGYPGSIDGHTFRVADVLRMIDGQAIENPLMLETILAHRCQMLAQERPLMACYPEQALVGVPVNTVADDQRRPHGQRFPQPADELNARFLAGERIDLDALDFSGVDACHVELPFAWRSPLDYGEFSHVAEVGVDDES